VEEGKVAEEEGALDAATDESEVRIRRIEVEDREAQVGELMPSKGFEDGDVEVLHDAGRRLPADILRTVELETASIPRYAPRRL
jgi:hypothetical protein